MPPPVTEGAFYCVFTVCLNSEEVFGFLTLPTAKAGGFLLQPSLPTIDRSYTMSTSVGITPSFRVPHGTYV